MFVAKVYGEGGHGGPSCLVIGDAAGMRKELGRQNRELSMLEDLLLDEHPGSTFLFMGDALLKLEHVGAAVMSLQVAMDTSLHNVMQEQEAD